MTRKQWRFVASTMIWFPEKRFSPRKVCSFCFLLVVVGCDPASNKEGFQVVPIYNQGPGQRAQNYIAFVPSTQSESFPVLLFLHGHGEKGSDGLFQISNNFGQSVWRRRNQFPFLAVCPQCPIGYEWEADGPNGTHAIECLSDAIRRFKGDPKRVFIAGISSGANGAMDLFSSNPHRFAGILLCSSGVGGDLAFVPSTNLPIRSLVNKYDRVELLRETNVSKLKWMNAGLSPSVSIIQGSRTLPHNAWDETYDSPVSLAWLLQSTRAIGNNAPLGFQLLPSLQVLKSWNQSSSNLWKSIESDELFGEPSDEESYLRSPFQHGDAEIHFEFFLEPKTKVQLQVRCETPDAIPGFGSAIDLVLELPESGTGGVRNENGDWIALLDSAAQHALLEGWNEVRIKRDSRNLTVTVGLWPTIQIDGLKVESGVQWSILNGTSGTRVRNIRIPRSSNPSTLEQSKLGRTLTDVQP